MGISVADNFKHLSKKFLDDRESFDTLADMKAVSDSDIPEGFETYCKATDKRYKFLSTNTVDSTTGKWREVEYGGGGTSDYTDLENKPQIDGVTLTGNKTASDLGLAKVNQIPTVPTKVSQLQNDSGFITDSALPGVYAGDTAGLVPAAGSGNEGKYLDNDGNWTTVPMPMIGTINRSDIYDTTEKVVGKWTDGRPIYQKTIQSTVPTVTTAGTRERTEINISSFNIKNVVNIFGCFYSDYDSAPQAIPFTTLNIGAENNTGFGARIFTGNSGNLFIESDCTVFNSRTAYITLQYTKTTDSANSYNYADENDYSTSEKIIGTWIDGKTLYQKTLTGTLANASTLGVAVNTFVSVGATINEFIDYDCMIVTNAGKCNKAPVAGMDTNNNYMFIRLIGETNSSTASSKNGVRIDNAWYTSGTNTYKLTVKYTKTS